MARKFIGYILALIGIATLAISLVQQLQTLVKVPENSTLTITIVSIVLILIGLVFITKGGSAKKLKEVPIFQGKNVVGYRRH